jgi:hypothetical protein
VVAGLGAYRTSTVAAAAAVTVGVVLVLRPARLLVTQHVPRWLHSRLGGEGEKAADGEGNGQQGGDDKRSAAAERPLPGTVEYEQAVKFTETFLKGQPHRGRPPPPCSKTRSSR